MDHLTLPTRDLNGFQDETLLDGELVWDERRGEMVYYIFDGIMFMAKNLTTSDLNGRLQVIQNDVIGPYQAREERNANNIPKSIYEETFPFKLRLKQMWKPYGLKELFERVIPSQGHENDGLIFTPVKDSYMAGTCNRLLKWKPSELNSVDFLIVIEDNSSRGQLFMASHGRPCYYTDFDPSKDEDLSKKLEEGAEINGRIAEFRLNTSHPNKWTFMRFRPDKHLPNDSKTVEKVIQSIRDNVKRDDLLQRESVIRSNWKLRETNQQSLPATNGTFIVPFSQALIPEVGFKYPLNLRTEAAKSAYQEADGWLELLDLENEEMVEPQNRKKIKLNPLEMSDK